MRANADEIQPSGRSGGWEHAGGEDGKHVNAPHSSEAYLVILRLNT